MNEQFGGIFKPTEEFKKSIARTIRLATTTLDQNEITRENVRLIRISLDKAVEEKSTEVYDRCLTTIENLRHQVV